jgi:hypothetical protein
MTGIIITNGVRRMNDVDIEFLEDFCQEYGLSMRKV